MPEREYFERERERERERGPGDRRPEGERNQEPRRGDDRSRGGQSMWDRGSGGSGGGDDVYRGKGNAFSYTGNEYQTYQRGGSGSEGGSGEDQSYGPPRDLSDRGGGTGIRENERERDRSRGGQQDRRMGGGSSGAGGTSSDWSGGRSSNQASRGSFAGKGPKGYQRSDERIREEINERLTAHPEIDATEIDVQVQSCEVVLTGTVEDRHAKRLAEDVAENVPGVKDVRNNIRVQRSDPGNAPQDIPRY